VEQKSRYIMHLATCRRQSLPTDSAEEPEIIGLVDPVNRLLLAADDVERHQKLWPKQFLWRNRVRPEIGIEDIRVFILCHECLIDHLPNGTQRTILRHSLFRAYRNEQCLLLYFEFSHPQYPLIGMFRLLVVS